MDYIEVRAKTIDDAITDALVQLGVTSDQLDYEVIEKGSAGFLGINRKDAVIKARKKVVVPEKKPRLLQRRSLKKSRLHLLKRGKAYLKRKLKKTIKKKNQKKQLHLLTMLLW